MDVLYDKQSQPQECPKDWSQVSVQEYTEDLLEREASSSILFRWVDLKAHERKTLLDFVPLCDIRLQMLWVASDRVAYTVSAIPAVLCNGTTPFIRCFATEPLYVQSTEPWMTCRESSWESKSEALKKTFIKAPQVFSCPALKTDESKTMMESWKGLPEKFMAFGTPVWYRWADSGDRLDPLFGEDLSNALYNGLTVRDIPDGGYEQLSNEELTTLFHDPDSLCIRPTGPSSVIADFSIVRRGGIPGALHSSIMTYSQCIQKAPAYVTWNNLTKTLKWKLK